MDSLFQSTPNTHRQATETMPYIRRGIFDTHAHYDDEAFDEDRDELLAKLPAQGIARVDRKSTRLNSSHMA